MCQCLFSIEIADLQTRKKVYKLQNEVFEKKEIYKNSQDSKRSQ